MSQDRADQKLTGEALRNLREAARPKVFQKDIGEALGISTQAWQKHEDGERKFTEERINTALDTIGASREDLDREKARILGRPIREAANDRREEFVFDVYGRARAGPQGPEVYDLGAPLRRLDLRQILTPSTDVLQIAGDSVTPWAESGEFVMFDRSAPPRRGEGCVVELNGGEVYVKFYEKSDGSTLFVGELFPEIRTITFPLKDVRGIYPVTMRLRG